MTSEDRHLARYERRVLKRNQNKAKALSQYGDYDKVFTYANLYAAYKKSVLGVGWKASIQKFKNRAFYSVGLLYNELQKGTYRSKGFTEFDLIERGKKRHIKSVHISERVVQRCICDYSLVPLLSNSFIYDNGASLKGKGIDFSRNRIVKHLTRYARTKGNNGYVLTFDFSKYFDFINHDQLKRIIHKYRLDERLEKLTFYFIDCFGDIGLGLGSQVSQISALAFPNEIDHYIKEKLHIKYYGRYMDDGYLIHESKEYLTYCLKEIKRLCTKLGIKLNDKKTQITRLDKGFIFLKSHYYISDSNKIIRIPTPKGIVTMRRKLKIFKTWLGNNFSMEDVRTSMMSWLGHVKKLTAHNQIFKMRRLYINLYGGSYEIL